MRRQSKRGFTLAELLIALAILGVIATFTIPKVLQAQQDGKYKAITKEAAGMISNAMMVYKSRNQLTASIGIDDLTPYLNYVKIDTTTTVDDRPSGAANVSCTGTRCLRLHNGAMLFYEPGSTFGGTATTNAVYFKLDPNGQFDGQPSGQAATLWLYINGKVTSYCCIEPNTTYFNGSVMQSRNPTPGFEPTWFSWD